MPNPPTILVFDSGLGGLTVFREVVKARPDARYLYVADDAFFPYSSRGEAELVARVVALMGELIDGHRPDLIVIACNTASTLALPQLRARYSVPFVGTVPAIKPACAASAHAARVGARHRGDRGPRIYPRAHPRLRQWQRRDAGRLGAARGLRRGGAQGHARRRRCDRATRSRPASSTQAGGAPTRSCSPAPTIRCCSSAWSGSRPGR